MEEKRLLLKSGMIVDATIIAAPPSTKNAEKARDPEMRQTRKRKERCAVVGWRRNAARLFTAFALANLYLLRRRLPPPGETYVP